MYMNMYVCVCVCVCVCIYNVYIYIYMYIYIYICVYIHMESKQAPPPPVWPKSALSRAPSQRQELVAQNDQRWLWCPPPLIKISMINVTAIHVQKRCLVRPCTSKTQPTFRALRSCIAMQHQTKNIVFMQQLRWTGQPVSRSPQDPPQHFP